MTGTSRRSEDDGSDALLAEFEALLHRVRRLDDTGRTAALRRIAERACIDLALSGGNRSEFGYPLQGLATLCHVMAYGTHDR